VVKAGSPEGPESEETTHFSVVDKEGNGVATTTTINRGYGSGVTIQGAGFLMNNEMDDFSSKPGHPNSYGLIQGQANSIAGGKRPLSAMTPTVVKKGDKLFMVLGSPGGPTIINTVLQVILNVVDFGLTIQEAVDAPRIHHQWKPDRILAERGALVRDVADELRVRGHRIEFRNSIGDAHSILIQSEDGVRLGAPDPRSDSKASGY
jgi:gamma-glutamyltranspeptidase/glutathione hydrolase